MSAERDTIRPRIEAALEEAARALGVGNVPDLEVGRARNPEAAARANRGEARADDRDS